MGNSKSKVAKAELNEKLDQAEQKHASAVKTIVVREEELERCKREAATATSESEALKKKAEDLEAKYETLQRQRAIEVEGLKKELANELEGQVRIHESLTQERNRERKRVEQLEEKVKEVESSRDEQVAAAGTAQNVKIKDLEQQMAQDKATAEKERKQFQESAEAEKKALDEARAEATKLEEKARTLESDATAANEKLAAVELSHSAGEQKNTALSSQLETIQSQLSASRSSASDWEEKHNTLQTQLSSLTSTQDSKLQTLHTDLSSSQQKQRDLTKQVTTLQKKLDLAESKRGDMEKKYNEGVSKKSALHEAFEATKMELKESYERYAELHKEVEKLKTDAAAAKNPITNGEGMNGAVLAAQKAAAVSVEEVKA